jgi:hypothetical protein
MNRFIRMLGIAAALVFTAAAANAVKGDGYSAAFPCQVKTGSQTVAAGTMNIPVTSNTCESAGALYSISASSFPKGFIAKHTLKGALTDAVAGAAWNVKGTVRSDTPITLAGTTGRDVLIDVKNPKATVHLRVFFVGDKQYQVMFVGPTGQENGKAAKVFLASFKLGK